MAKDPSFPFYMNDWLSSLKVRRLTSAERGAFVDMLCHCWASGNASLEDDERSLEVASGMTAAEWKVSSQTLRKLFEPHFDFPGFLTNKKLYGIWKDREKFRDSAKKGGKASGESRRKANGVLKKTQTKVGSISVDESFANRSRSVEPELNSSSSYSSSEFILSSLEDSLNGKDSEDKEDSQIQESYTKEDIPLYKAGATDVDKLLELESTIATNLGLYTPEFSQIWDLLPSRMKAAQIKVWGIWPDVIRHVMESHKITYDAAHAHIRQKVRAFSASPRGQRKTFSWTGLSFFKDGHFDDDPESWVVHEEKANGRKKVGHTNANQSRNFEGLVYEEGDEDS